MKSKAAPFHAKTPVTVRYDGKTLELKQALVYNIFVETNGTTFAETKDGFCAGVIESIGKGKIIFFSGETGDNPIQPAAWKNPNPDEKTFVEGAQIDAMKQENGGMVSLLAGKRISVVGAPNIVPTLYRVNPGMALHLVNTANMVSQMDSYVEVDEPLPQFMDTDPDRKLLPELVVKLDRVQLGENVKATIASPEIDAEQEISICKIGEDEYQITIPADLFSGYALVKLCF